MLFLAFLRFCFFLGELSTAQMESTRNGVVESPNRALESPFVEMSLLAPFWAFFDGATEL